jgi:hypothetical protein
VGKFDRGGKVAIFAGRKKNLRNQNFSAHSFLWARSMLDVNFGRTCFTQVMSDFRFDITERQGTARGGQKKCREKLNQNIQCKLKNERNSKLNLSKRPLAGEKRNLNIWP